MIKLYTINYFRLFFKFFMFYTFSTIIICVLMKKISYVNFIIPFIILIFYSIVNKILLNIEVIIENENNLLKVTYFNFFLKKVSRSFLISELKYSYNNEKTGRLVWNNVLRVFHENEEIINTYNNLTEVENLFLIIEFEKLKIKKIDE